MELVIRFGEREERVQIEASADGYRVRVGEVAHVVDARRSTQAGAVSVWSLLVDGQQAEVALRPAEDGFQVHSAFGHGLAEVADPLAHLARQAKGAGAAGARVVKAYMPGRVVAILAEEGSEVAAGQGIVVLEAMKMENEIAAETAGTLKHLFVQKGQAVEGGDKLFEIG